MRHTSPKRKEKHGSGYRMRSHICGLCHQHSSLINEVCVIILGDVLRKLMSSVLGGPSAAPQIPQIPTLYLFSGVNGPVLGFNKHTLQNDKGE